MDPNTPLPEKSTNIKFDGFFYSGILLALWAIANTWVDIARYGAGQGYYWWFCNLALIGTAWGLLTRSRGWLTGFLSIASYTQMFWVVDNIWRATTGENLFGIVEFMYQPGMPVAEFMLAHYHYVTMPICLLALILMPQEKNNSLKLVLIWNPIIFGVSYFAFSKTQNVNCIHEPCIATLSSWDGPLYSLLFWLACFSIHILIVRWLDRTLLNLKIDLHLKKVAKQSFAGVMMILAAITVVDVRYKNSLPSFTCNVSDTGKTVVPRCRYTLDYDPQVMLMVYDVINRSQTTQRCETFIYGRDKKIPLHRELWLSEGETLTVKALVAYPQEDVSATLQASCHPLKRTPSSVSTASSLPLVQF